MIGIVFATNREANPFLLKSGLDPEPRGSQAVFDLRPDRQMVVCICGMGPAAALYNTKRLLDQCPVSSVINAGIAGAVAEGKATGSIYRITSTLTWPINGSACPCHADRWANLPTASLATVERPVFDQALRKEIACHADLVDMEAAFIARICLEHNTPFQAIKGISDQAGEGDKRTLYANLDIVAEAIAELLWKELSSPVVAACLRMPIGVASHAATKRETPQ